MNFLTGPHFRNDQTSWHSRSALDLYSGDTRFEFRLGYLPSQVLKSYHVIFS